ncbi:Nucleotidylyl transferase [Trametes coccinea BRFM310]|uniref:Nucleotidylyl transferase n=1 Tax=Trametes coccinea (strain BRFM310) TaxID=1353009 RepID=A0A1Y2IEB0_TRAC3|nr:Nucleotidylyl transferase [Trametes coccinea BRFM310]
MSDMNYTSLLQRIQKGLSVVELVHTSHPRWPLPPHPNTPPSPTLQISVLDSSFNPPTLAHLALANTVPPPPTVEVLTPPSASRDFDARLLLLSVRNADKQLKPGDATYEQRVEMMVLLAQDLARSRARNIPAARETVPEAAPHEPNVAVAIIDEPTFVGKSAILRDFLSKRITELLGPAEVASASSSVPPPSPKLTFLMGTDTIVRLFAPRYYADEKSMMAALRRFLSPDGDDARVVCARRVSRGVPRAEEERIEVEMSEFARKIVPIQKLSFVDIGERECTFSSSEVRESLAKRDERWKDMVTRSIAEYITSRTLYTSV